MRRDDRAIWPATLASLALLCLWAGEALADRSAVLILLQDGEATTVQGRFDGATLGEPITVMVDTTSVFGSGFE